MFKQIPSGRHDNGTRGQTKLVSTTRINFHLAKCVVRYNNDEFFYMPI